MIKKNQQTQSTNICILSYELSVYQYLLQVLNWICDTFTTDPTTLFLSYQHSLLYFRTQSIFKYMFQVKRRIFFFFLLWLPKHPPHIQYFWALMPFLLYESMFFYRLHLNA